MYVHPAKTPMMDHDSTSCGDGRPAKLPRRSRAWRRGPPGRVKFAQPLHCHGFAGLLAIDHHSTSTHAPGQQSLFDDEPANPPSALIVLAAVNRPRTPAQRSFNRLVERIDGLHESLAAWDAYIPRFRRRILAELVPAEDAIRSAQRRLVLQLDVLLGNKVDRLRR